MVADRITRQDLGSDLWLSLLADVLEAVGQSGFENCLLELLSKRLGVDHCAVFTYSDEKGSGHLFTVSKMLDREAQGLADDYISTFAGRDPQLPRIQDARAEDSESLGEAVHPDLARDYDFDYLNHFFRGPDLVDKLYTVSEIDDTKVYCNFYRMGQSGPYQASDKAVLNALLPLITNIITNHFKVVRFKLKGVATPGANVARNMVHAVLSQQVPPFDRLTAREAEICERILVGYTSLGIGLDLGIAASSVNTYRRRAYEKLNISAQNELFSLCLEALGQAAPH